MRQPYVHIDPSVYEKYYISQAGFGIDVYRSPITYQRGYGLGSIFRSLFKMATPLLKSGARVLGRQALKTGIDLASDALANKDMKQSFQRRMKEAGVNLMDEALQRGTGIKRRRVRRKRVRSKSDVFE